MNQNITPEIITSNPTWEWDWESLTETVPLTLDMIKRIKINWNLSHLSNNKHLTLDIFNYFPIMVVGIDMVYLLIEIS